MQNDKIKQREHKMVEWQKENNQEKVWNKHMRRKIHFNQHFHKLRAIKYK